MARKVLHYPPTLPLSSLPFSSETLFLTRSGSPAFLLSLNTLSMFHIEVSALPEHSTETLLPQKSTWQAFSLL